MNIKTLLVMGTVVALSALAGCASMKSKDSTASSISPQDQVDAAYVAEVNENAKHHFVQVYWINPPVKSHN